MKKFLLTFTLLLSLITAMAQDRYIIFLKDKANSPFSISNPSNYLSARAIARKTRMNIFIDSLVTGKIVNKHGAVQIGYKIYNKPFNYNNKYYCSVTIDWS